MGQVATWGITIVVMRLLTPGDYGLLSLASVFIALFSLVSEVGLSDAVVQSPGCQSCAASPGLRRRNRHEYVTLPTDGIRARPYCSALFRRTAAELHNATARSPVPSQCIVRTTRGASSTRLEVSGTIADRSWFRHRWKHAKSHARLPWVWSLGARMRNACTDRHACRWAQPCPSISA